MKSPSLFCLTGIVVLSIASMLRAEPIGLHLHSAGDNAVWKGSVIPSDGEFSWSATAIFDPKLDSASVLFESDEGSSLWSNLPLFDAGNPDLAVFTSDDGRQQLTLDLSEPLTPDSLFKVKSMGFSWYPEIPSNSENLQSEIVASGRTQGLMPVPIPEPSVLSMLFLGMLCCVGYLRGR